MKPSIIKLLLVTLFFCSIALVQLVVIAINQQATLDYQLQLRISLEREQDALNKKIRSYQNYLPDNENKPFPEYIELKIKILSQENSIDPNVAFAIAVCESNLNPYAKNPNSTAKGLFQFLDGTWNWIGANGSQYDPEEQVRQFMIWYPKNSGWWRECLNKI